MDQISPKHLVLPATGWAGNGAEWGDGGAPRLRAVLCAAGMVGSKRAPGSVGAPGNGAAPARRARCSARSVRRRDSGAERAKRAVPRRSGESECKRASLYT